MLRKNHLCTLCKDHLWTEKDGRERRKHVLIRLDWAILMRRGVMVKGGQESVSLLWELLCSRLQSGGSSEGLFSCMPKVKEKGEHQGFYPQIPQLLAWPISGGQTVEAATSLLSKAMERGEGEARVSGWDTSREIDKSYWIYREDLFVSSRDTNRDAS